MMFPVAVREIPLPANRLTNVGLTAAVFNIRGEPIVCSTKDAFRCFMGTNLDILAIEDFILFKSEQNVSLIKKYKNQFNLD